MLRGPKAPKGFMRFVLQVCALLLPRPKQKQPGRKSSGGMPQTQITSRGRGTSCSQRVKPAAWLAFKGTVVAAVVPWTAHCAQYFAHFLTVHDLIESQPSAQFEIRTVWVLSGSTDLARSCWHAARKDSGRCISVKRVTSRRLSTDL